MGSETPTSDRATPTLYEWAGGYEAIETLFQRFYELVFADELLHPLFKDMDHDHPKHVAVWLSEVFGGPDDYTREHGGYENMVAHHVGKSITETQRRRWVNLLVDAADAVGLPADAEFPRRVHELCRVGHASRARELAAGRVARAACPGPALGLGSRPALSAVTAAVSASRVTGWRRSNQGA